jgi:hypothetical protein
MSNFTLKLKVEESRMENEGCKYQESRRPIKMIHFALEGEEGA